MRTTIANRSLLLSRNAFKAGVLCVLAMAGTVAEAMPVSIDLGSAPNITSHVATAFDDLNGTQLHGQTLSLDFLFGNSEFARLFSVTDPSFAVLITLQTSGSGIVGFLDGTGFLLDENGAALGTPELLGSASRDDGSMSAGLFPLLSGEFATPVDFFGVHTDLMLPANLPLTVTGGEFQLVAAGATPHDVFGIGPGVPRDLIPDSGGTLLLLSLTVVALGSIRKRVPSHF